MRKLTRAAMTVAATGALVGGSFATVAPAQAAGPGDLQILGGVNCEFKLWGPNWKDGPVWQMHRFMGVRNAGGSTMTGVTVVEFGGPSKWVPAKTKAQAAAAGAYNPRKTKTGELLPGQTAITHTNTWKGCWPSSISGYTIGEQVENPFNNVGFWQNVRNAKPEE